MSGAAYIFNQQLNALVAEQCLNITGNPIEAIKTLLLDKNNSFDRLCKDTCDKMMNPLYSLRQTSDFTHFITILINSAQGRTFHMLVIAYLILYIVKIFPEIRYYIDVKSSGWMFVPSGVWMDCRLVTDSRIGRFINLDYETINDWDYRFNNIGNPDILGDILV